MRRKLFTAAAIAPTALCIGICVFWVRSYGAVWGHWLVQNPSWAGKSEVRRYWFVRSAAGKVELYGVTMTESAFLGLHTGLWSPDMPEPEAWDLISDEWAQPALRIPYPVPFASR